MHQYQRIITDILDNGQWQENRTGIKTISLPGAMMRFDLQKGFPAITTKKLAFKSAMGEMVGFLRGSRSAADFRSLGSKVWDANANDNAAWLANPYRLGTDDIGVPYGVQWRNWPAYKLINLDLNNASAQIDNAEKHGYKQLGIIDEFNPLQAGMLSSVIMYKAIDQLRTCLDTIINDPTNRRILFHSWNVAQLEEMSLPPCHLLYQFLVNTTKKEISLCLYIRSNDMGLGAPFNMAEGAALLSLVGRLTGYTPRWFTYFVGDCHIYANHLDALEEQLRNDPLPAPQLVISDRIPDYAITGKYEPEWLDKVEPSDFELVGYKHYVLENTMEMAV